MSLVPFLHRQSPLSGAGEGESRTSIPISESQQLLQWHSQLELFSIRYIVIISKGGHNVKSFLNISHLL